MWFKNTIKFFAGFRGEASRLEKATDALSSQTKFYGETQSAAAETTKICQNLYLLLQKRQQNY